jgi:hypothetical protein
MTEGRRQTVPEIEVTVSPEEPRTERIQDNNICAHDQCESSLQNSTCDRQAQYHSCERIQFLIHIDWS